MIILSRHHWWKTLCVLLLTYTLFAGLLGGVPARFILNESIRNLYFHVPMWFGMLGLFTGSFVYAIKYLRSGNPLDDLRSVSWLKVGVLFSILGMITGMIWATYTWGEPWSNDPKQLGTAVCMLSYFAYLVLRSGIPDDEKRAKIAAVYNVFAYAMIFPLLFVIPRIVDSLHPGNGGNPAFSNYDLDAKMRLVFYPAVIGWFLLGLWMTQLRIRLGKIQNRIEDAQPFRHA
ncbi:MAG: ABC transporter permease [Sphingobacteriales bacterium]|nr:MAG: ABC transporter permease [Sphingobacteriales bacterium]